MKYDFSQLDENGNGDTVAVCPEAYLSVSCLQMATADGRLVGKNIGRVMAFDTDTSCVTIKLDTWGYAYSNPEMKAKLEAQLPESLHCRIVEAGPPVIIKPGDPSKRGGK